MIREATIDDANIIGDIIVQAWRSAYSNIIDPEYPQSMRSEKFSSIITNNIDQKLEQIFVYEQDDSVKGFISGKSDSKSENCEIVGFYILPEWQNRGIGKALLKEAKQHFRQNGCREMVIRTLLNAKNNEFYRKQGGIDRESGMIDIGDNSYPGIEFVFSLQ